MDTLSYMMNLIGGVYEDDRGYRHYRVPNKTYDIKMHPMTLEWSCNCPAYKFGRGNDEISKMRDAFKTGESLPF